MTAKRRKPLLVNLTWAVVAICLVYVASYFACSAMLGAEWLSEDAVVAMDQSVFYPLIWYTHSGLPGSETFTRVSMWCYYRASGLPVPF